ncbi:MAG: branched-chain amino acid ABC transporter permease [Candidatus Izimaplasma sp.]|nr:branched-chain amino acid ABC transporter permease [Candidatus Izimaplasma bacterium]
MGAFWLELVIVTLILFVVYSFFKIFFLKYFSNKTRVKSIAINIMVVIALFYVFIIIYQAAKVKYGESAFDYMVFQVINQIPNIAILTLATTAIVLIYKTSRTTNFAQSMMATFGAYFAAKTILFIGEDRWSQTTTILLAMLAGALVAFLLGVFIDAVIIRYSRDKTPVGKQMITMGLVIILSGGMPILFGTNPLSIAKIVPASEKIELAFLKNIGFISRDLFITKHSLYALLITVGLLGILFSLLRFTKWGLGVRATASNERVASMMGVNTKLITALSWGIAGFLGGVAAVIMAPSDIGPALMVSTQVNGFIAAVMGSFTSFAGPLIAGIIIPPLRGLLVSVVGSWNIAVLYAIILAVVLVKPEGLFGKKIEKKV